MGEPAGAFTAEPDPATILTAAEKPGARAGTGGEIDDILATSASWFHVFRMVPGAGGGYIVHLVLDRTRANLTEARREFRNLVEADRVSSAMLAAAPKSTFSKSARRKRRSRAAVDEPVQSPTTLPQRIAGQSWSERSVEVTFPDWFAPGDDEPHAVDKLTLDRVMEGLRRLA
jgi:hypothetical protein